MFKYLIVYKKKCVELEKEVGRIVLVTIVVAFLALCRLVRYRKVRMAKYPLNEDGRRDVARI